MSENEMNVRYVKCTFCGWKHSYDASIAENTGKAWEKANSHAMECESDPRNIELSALRAEVEALKRIAKAAKAVSGNLSKIEIIDIDDKEYNVWGIVGDAEKDELAAALNAPSEGQKRE